MMTAVLIAIAIVMLGSAAVAMALRNIIHSALLLTLNWMGVAAFYLWAGAEFAAFAQVIVYIGGVSMIVLFAVLLTRRKLEGEESAPDRAAIGRASAAVITAGIVCGVLIGAVRAAEFVSVRDEAPELTVKQIGHELMGPQAAALLVVGVILTVALLGAVVIASKKSSDDAEDRSSS